ncbi:sulfatase-like hydrolase/transferase [Pontibacter sp. G13]|uniref:sulfatase-like hydrolase/transferase n=1 Tax=Pontibacter sp. G13 TaxID=3074898 RepID=UPI00288B4DA7|nr:sulfatase-like hydrolase/transferase [Pontibacter sp. G13]WNJ19122.1 sulfatase-like hydrolase/transferase [Pontibacter sp. G13]
MKRLFTSLLIIAGTTLSWHTSSGQSQQKNVVFIMVDDMNDWVGAFNGHPQTLTPNIDALAAKGMMFTNAHCAGPTCNPSRTALLTGRRLHETGIVGNGDGFFRSNDKPNWVQNLITLPQYFKQNGYTTVQAGKIFHQGGGVESDPISWTTQGTGFGAAKTLLDDYTIPGTNLTYSPQGENLANTSDFKIADWCSNFLEQSNQGPFFLACGIFRPHLPFYAPETYFDLYPTSSVTLPPYLANDLADCGIGSNGELQDVLNDGGNARWKELVQAYLACISFADACVGELLTTLENSEYANNTIVVLMGDHGWHLGEKDAFRKSTLWKRATKTPLIIYDPSNNGGSCSRAVSLQDVYPTLVDICNLPNPSHTVRGRSLYPLIQNPNTAWAGAALTQNGSASYALSGDDYRYIKYSNGSEEFYDLAADPNEWTNVVNNGSYASALQDYQNALAALLAHDETPFGTGTPGGGGGGGGGTPSDLTDLSSTAMNCSTVSLSWTDTNGETGYRVRRKVVGATSYTNLTDVAAGSTSYTDNSVAANTDYQYMVRPLVNGTAVAISNTPTISVGDCSTGGGGGTPVDLTDVSVVATSCSTVVVSWSDGPGETAYRIRRKVTGATTFANLGDVNADVTTYTDATAVSGTNYTYQVRPVVNGGAVAASNQPTIVIPACGGGSGAPIPGTLQAEDYDNQSGIQTESTSDAGGGLNVGFIQNGDFIEFDVFVSAAGTYDVDFRVATNTSGGTIQLKNGSTLLASAAVSNTGGWQSWSTVSTSANLSAGAQTLKLEFVGGSGFLFNINWADFASAGGNRKAQVQALPAWTVYPNPTTGIVTIEGLAEMEEVEIFNLAGASVMKSQTSGKLNIEELPAGTYILQVGSFQSVRLVKQ